MCCLQNTEQMVSFIGSLADCVHNRIPVFVEMKHVNELELNAVTVLLSVMIQFKATNLKFNGDKPLDPRAHAVLNQSGFFMYLGSEYRVRDAYDLIGSTIYTHGKKMVDTEFSQNLIEQAAQTIWGEPRRCPGLYRVFVELMQNTNNHASLEGAGEQHYWISLQHFAEQRRVVFTFVDFGVGIFENLLNKPLGHPFFGVIAKVKRFFGLSDNAGVLQKIFEGEVHRTSTKKYYRGKGLPGIFNVFQANKISNLAMITNDVFYNSIDGSYAKLKKNFSGTLITWELNENNESLRSHTEAC